MAFRFNYDPNAPKPPTPEKYRSIAITGPTYDIEGERWVPVVAELVEEFIKKYDEPILVLTESYTCFKLLPDIRNWKKKYPTLTVKLVTLSHKHWFYHIVPYEFRDEMLEFSGEKFPEFVEAMSMLDDFPYLKDVLSLEKFVKNKIYLEDKVWSANCGIDMNQNAVTNYLRKQTCDILAVELYQDKTPTGGYWWREFRQSGATLRISENFEKDDNVHLSYNM